MKKDNIVKAVNVAKAFILAAEELKKAYNESAYESNGHTYHSFCPKESGALRRASMDLTRALADMRRP